MEKTVSVVTPRVLSMSETSAPQTRPSSTSSRSTVPTPLRSPTSSPGSSAGRCSDEVPDDDWVTIAPAGGGRGSPRSPSSASTTSSGRPGPGVPTRSRRTSTSGARPRRRRAAGARGRRHPARAPAVHRGRFRRLPRPGRAPVLPGVMSAPAIEAVGLVRSSATSPRSTASASRCPPVGVLDARPERRGQDDDGADDDDAQHPDQRHRPGGRVRRRRRGRRRPPPDGPDRPVGHGRRTAHRSREPPLDRRPLRADRHAGAVVRRRSCSSGSRCPRPATRWSRTTPAACAGASTSPPASSPHHRCSSSTSPPPASTPAVGSSSGGCCATSCATAQPCSSRPSTSTRPTSSPTDIVVVDHGRIIAQGTPLELKDQSGAASLVSRCPSPTELEAAGPLASDVPEVHVDRDARQLTAPAEGCPT